MPRTKQNHPKNLKGEFFIPALLTHLRSKRRLLTQQEEQARALILQVVKYPRSVCYEEKDSKESRNRGAAPADLYSG